MPSTTNAARLDYSPSPPRSPPNALSPGPRASKLQEVFNEALTHTLRVCSYSNFATCFPTPAQFVPEALDTLHRDFVGRLGDACKTEFLALMDERAVVARLNEFDTLQNDAKKRKERAITSAVLEGPQREVDQVPPTPPHLLLPSSLVAAHLAAFLSTEEAALKRRLEVIQASNKILANEAMMQRATIENLLQGLEGAVLDLQGAAGTFGRAGMQGVEQELEMITAIATSR